MLLRCESCQICACQIDSAFFFLFLFLVILFFHVCQHPAAWDRSAVTHSSAAQVRGYSGAGLDKLACAGIPSGPFKGERVRNSGGMFLQSVGLLVKHSMILQNRSCCSFVPKSLVFYDCWCVNRGTWDRESESRQIKGGDAKCLQETRLDDKLINKQMKSLYHSVEREIA